MSEELSQVPGQTFPRINRVIISAALFDADSIVMIPVKKRRKGPDNNGKGTTTEAVLLLSSIIS